MAQATLAEFEKVEAIHASTARTLDAAESKTRKLLGELAAQMWRQPADFGGASQAKGPDHGLVCPICAASCRPPKKALAPFHCRLFALY